MNQTTHILRSISLLPSCIEYAGFEFVPMVHQHEILGLGFGYILTTCTSKKKYKKKTYREFGVWDERDANRRLSSTGCDFLFFVPIDPPSDEHFSYAIKTMFAHLTKYNLLDPENLQPLQKIRFPE